MGMWYLKGWDNKWYCAEGNIVWIALISKSQLVDQVVSTVFSDSPHLVIFCSCKNRIDLVLVRYWLWEFDSPITRSNFKGVVALHCVPKQHKLSNYNFGIQIPPNCTGVDCSDTSNIRNIRCHLLNFGGHVFLWNNCVKFPEPVALEHEKVLDWPC